MIFANRSNKRYILFQKIIPKHLPLLITLGILEYPIEFWKGAMPEQLWQFLFHCLNLKHPDSIGTNYYNQDIIKSVEWVSLLQLPATIQVFFYIIRSRN